MIYSPLSVSVVIPTFRRPHLLHRCLEALFHQTLDPDRFEVIVADDGLDESTLLEARTLAEKAPFTVRYVPVLHGRGPAAARNEGWRNAAGALIAFTDDDTIAAPSWLFNGITPFADLKVMAIWGRITIPLGSNPTDYELDASRLQGAGFVTANCFCRKSLLEKIGGFDERFTAAWREDTDLYFSIIEYLTARESEGKVIRWDAAEVLHPVRPESWGISIKQQRKAIFDALLYKKHRYLYRQNITNSTCRLYYILLLSLLVIFLGGSTPYALLSWIALGLWTTLTGWFIWHRLRYTSKKPSHIWEMVVTSLVIPYLSLYWRLRGAFRYKVLFL